MQVFDLKRGWNAVVITLNLLPDARREMLSQGAFAFDLDIGGYRLLRDESELEPGAMLWLHSRTTGAHAYRADIPETAISDIGITPAEPGTWCFRCYATSQTLPQDVPLTAWLWCGEGRWKLVTDGRLEAQKGYFIYWEEP